MSKRVSGRKGKPSKNRGMSRNFQNRVKKARRKVEDADRYGWNVAQRVRDFVSRTAN